MQNVNADGSKTAKITRDLNSDITHHRLNGNVMLSNITFLWFLRVLISRINAIDKLFYFVDNLHDQCQHFFIRHFQKM